LPGYDVFTFSDPDVKVAVALEGILGGIQYSFFFPIRLAQPISTLEILLVNWNRAVTRGRSSAVAEGTKHSRIMIRMKDNFICLIISRLFIHTRL
jgi:hypothetical protein